MANPAAILAQGTVVTVGDGAASTAVIDGIESISGLGSGSAGVIDTTSLSSTAKESLPGLKDEGEVTFNFSRRNEDDAGQAELREMEAAQEVREFVIVLDSSTLKTVTFDGHVQSLTTDINSDSAVTGACTVKITGPLVWS